MVKLSNKSQTTHIVNNCRVPQGEEQKKLITIKFVLYLNWSFIRSSTLIEYTMAWSLVQKICVVFENITKCVSFMNIEIDSFEKIMCDLRRIMTTILSLSQKILWHIVLFFTFCYFFRIKSFEKGEWLTFLSKTVIFSLLHILHVTSREKKTSTSLLRAVSTDNWEGFSTLMEQNEKY